MPESAISIHETRILQVAAFPGSAGPVSAFVGGIVNTAQNPSVVPADDMPDVFHVAPGRWWIVSRGGGLPATDGLDSASAAAVDLSSSRVVVRLRHPNWREVVAKGCGIDLADPRFATRSYAMTALGRFNVLLHASRDGAGCDIYVGRSLSGSLSKWLADALLEFQGA